MIASTFRPGLIACAGIALSALPALSQEPPARAKKDCLSVELILYSGRPRPQYLLCDEGEKKEVLGKLSEAKREKPESVPFPEMEGSPEYQGILLTLPRKPDERPNRLLLRKGYLKPSGPGKILEDSDRSLEVFFLDRSLKEKDVSASPTEGSPISDVAEPILKKVREEIKAK